MKGISMKTVKAESCVHHVKVK